MTSVVVVAAHGSRADAANTAHRELVRSVDANSAVKSTAQAVPAFLELAEPSIPDAIDAAVARGAATVLVLPYFLHPGRHLARDLTGIVAEATDRHPSTRIELLGLFGADPSLPALVAGQIEAALGAE